jgi:clan AA aspartic protease
MISGVVTDGREATIHLVIEGPSGGEASMDVVIDTGFNGYLTLPSAVISALGLRSHGVRRAILGDGRAVVLTMFRASVAWEGKLRPVQALEAEGSPLVGMALLEGSRVILDVKSGGAVTIEPLP